MLTKTGHCRHSRFGGTYVVQGTKALRDDKDLIVHRPLRQCNKISFDDGKMKLKKAKNRRPLIEESATRLFAVLSTCAVYNRAKLFSNIFFKMYSVP